MFRSLTCPRRCSTNRTETVLPGSFFDDLDGAAACRPQLQRPCDVYYGRIPTDLRQMWQNDVNYDLDRHLDVDRHIGAVLDALEASGEADDTIIIFTSDHGEMGGAHHLRQKGSVASGRPSTCLW